MPEEEYRIEEDAVVGAVEVPRSVLYGAQTQTARTNFTISDIRFGRPFIRALGLVKQASAVANVSVDRLDEERGDAIQAAAAEVRGGEHDEAFPLSIFQLGSGTNTNMNANEVIANRAAELLGEARGSRVVHPNDHVNMGQSSNDVIPTTIHVAARSEIESNLVPALADLQAALTDRAHAFDHVVKIGRTHLQDATPVRLGQEFAGYASQIEHGIGRLDSTQAALSELAIGGTAVGTGLNTHPAFPENVVAWLSEETGLSFTEARNHFEAQAGRDAVVETSGALKTIAVSLLKISNDIRWLSCGPRAGFREITIPTVHPAGSSIMPGKVNPAIPEAVCQAAAHVIGNDTAITVGGQSGNFEINVMKPVMAHNLLQSISLLAEAVSSFSEQCVQGIEANEAVCDQHARESLSLVTALAPRIGYDVATEIAKQAYSEDRTIKSVALERDVLDDAELDRVLDPIRMTHRGVTRTNEQ